MIEPAPRQDALARAHHAIHRAARIGAWLCGAMLLGVSILVVLEVGGRNFLGSRVHGAEEIAGYVFAISVAWGFGYCVLERSHIRLDFVYARLGAGMQRLWDGLSLLSLLLLSAFLARRAWITFHESWEFDATSTTSLHVPLWIPQFLWFLGMLFFAIASLFLAVHVAVLATRRHFGRLRDVAGIPGVQE